MRLRSILAGCAALVVLGGAAAVVAQRRSAPSAPDAADVTSLVEIAHNRLPAIANTPAVDMKSPVVATYTQHRPVYYGELTLWLTCAGAGEMTMVVSGTPHEEAGGGPPRELSRVATSCVPDPEPRRTVFTADYTYRELVFAVVDAAGAVGRAGFAWQVTSDTGEPVTDFNGESNPQTALHLTEHESDVGIGQGGAIDADQKMTHTMDDFSWHGRYTLAAACNGIGTLYVGVGRQHFKVRCSWPPKRQDFAIDRVRGGAPNVTLEYKSTSSAPSRYVLQFLPR